MTVTSPTTEISYTADGITTVWTYNFLVPSLSDGSAAMEVIVRNLATGVDTLLDPSVYSVSGVDNPTGGAVTYPLAGPPLAVGYNLYILRNLPYVQDISIPPQSLYPATVEELADLTTMLVQQTLEQLRRCVVAPTGDYIIALPPAAQRANKFLAFDSAGQPFASAGSGGGGGGVNVLAGKNVSVVTAGGNSTVNAILKPAPLSDFGPITGDGVTSNDTAFTAAEAGAESDIYLPDSTVSYKTSRTRAGLLKHYGGRGKILTSDPWLMPPNTQYINSLAQPAGTGNGVGGWFDGNQLFTNGGEYKILDGNFRTYSLLAGMLTVPTLANGNTLTVDTVQGAAIGQGITVGAPVVYTGKIANIVGNVITVAPALPAFIINAATIVNYNPALMNYFQSALIPQHEWMDVNTGASGVQGFLTTGAAAGATVITLHAAANPAWVGKAVGFATTFGGAIIESHIITATGGNTITLATPLLNTYTWNAGAGLTPMLTFGLRSWQGREYTLVHDNAGGDVYGNIVRVIMGYAAQPSETHVFMAGTGGQYGGSIDFNVGNVYATGWESQYNDNGHDVAVIAQVDSFTRGNDTSLTGGQVWLGTKFQSGGVRPADAGHVLTGPWRIGLDTVFATMEETSQVAVLTVASAASFIAKSINGAVVGDTINIGEPGAYLYSGTITSVNSGTKVVGVSPNLPVTPIAVGTEVYYPLGGSVLNMALGQRIVFNSSLSANARGGDPLGVFATNYGNVRGDMILESHTDGVSDYMGFRYNGTGHAGSVAHARLRPTVFQVDVVIQGGNTIEAASALVTDGGYTAGGHNDPQVVYGAGLGAYATFDVTNGWIKHFLSNAIAQVIGPNFTSVATTTVGALPAAATIGKGGRAIVTDSSVTAFNSIVAGGGATTVPVFCDAVNWRVG